MSRTTPPRTVDLDALFPELVPFRRDAIRLHPRRGPARIWDSSVGGRLMWPESEPWPVCEDPHTLWSQEDADPPVPPLPMVPVVQVHKEHARGFPWPKDRDLLQVLWCPANHEPYWTPRPLVVWRKASESVPACDVPHVPEHVEPDYLPAECLLHPEPITEYPGWGEIPKDVEEAIETRRGDLERTGVHFDRLATLEGLKLGGYPSWTQDPDWPDCEGCDGRMDLLVNISSREDVDEHWLPVEERALLERIPESARAVDLRAVEGVLGIMLGDVGGLYIFECRTCPGRPNDYRFDCS